MFGIGFIELMTVAVVALLVLGPERLPGAIRETAVWIGRIRRYASGVRRDLEEQLDDLQNDKMIADFKQGRKLLDEAQQSLNKDIRQSLGSEDKKPSENREA